MRKDMNIQEVARLAGVSVATVSRVLNDSPKVKEVTRMKVLDVIQKFDYQPNLLGRDLRRSETKKVLVITSALEKPILADVVKGIEICAKEHGYYVLVCPTSYNWNKEQELIQMLKNRLADGAITFSTALSEVELSEISKKYNIVQCCEYKKAPYTCSVSIDDEKAAFDAVNHLIELGHQHIALIGDNDTLSESSTLRREEGYKRALKSSGIPFRPDLMKYGSGEYMDGMRLTDELLLIKDPPTAIFCLNDILGVGCINAIKQHGYSIPDEIAVIGFDNTREALMSVPPLTTIHQPKYEIGYSAMELLIHNMTNSHKKYDNLMHQHEVIARGSTIGMK
ncbi:LacI family DNA-binding transcriptional regulator [Paenibacillus sp. BJ-4]|uniref:LacI family DNA-binding transcriptional regulator n=1 Tax=Paenibacillus sp. BJ-4 TaxID=2878097 RepID=UPI001CF0B8E7|nr:LacI family DNA-binding transcriptional regulator [Paenibacillus sp. BJ-4]